MSSHESSTEKKKAATEAMLKAINTQAPLPIDVIKQWLAVSELSYQKFADLMGCSLAAAKNWLCSYKEIPKKWDEEVRQRIQMKISCDSSFRAGAFSAAAANSGQQAPTEEELTYKIDPSLYGILSRIATMSRSTVFQIISDAVYSWSGDLIERSVFTRPAIAVEKLKASIERVNDLQKELKELRLVSEKKIAIYKRSRKDLQKLAALGDKQNIREELKSHDEKIDVETKYLTYLRESYHTLRELKEFMMEDLEGRPIIFIRKARRIVTKNTHP